MGAATVRAPVLGSVPHESRRSGRGLTLIELIVVICIIGVSAALLVDRLRFYQEAAEKAAMEYTVGAVKSALQLQVAAMLVRGEERFRERLAVHHEHRHLPLGIDPQVLGVVLLLVPQRDRLHVEVGARLVQRHQRDE